MPQVMQDLDSDIAQRENFAVANAAERKGDLGIGEQHVVGAPKRGFPNSIAHRRLSPTAAGPIACCPLKPLRRYARAVSRHAVLLTDCRSGAPRVCPSSRAAADGC